MRSSTRLARAALIAAALLAAPAAVGCIFFSSFDGLSGGGDDAGVPDGGGADVACGQVKSSPCEAIPAAPPGFTQVVDGDGAEFCTLPFITLDPAGGQYRTCPPPKWIGASGAHARVHLLWSPKGIHAHVRVDKATPIAPNDAGDFYKGDAVEVFFRNASTRKGAVPGASTALLGLTIVIPPPPSAGQKGVSSPAKDAPEWVSRRDGAGYDVELFVPWAALGGPVPQAGSKILWDFGLDVAGPMEPRYQTFLNYTAPDGGTVWCNEADYPKPSNNDIGWCNPVLSP